MKTCRNCGNNLETEDAFCTDCGQKWLKPGDRRLWLLVRQGFAEVMDFDGRIWRTLALLITRPGKLTREYAAGRRQRYLPPISVFLFANLVFFLAPTLTDFSVSLYDQLQLQSYSPLVSEWVEGVIAADGRTVAQAASTYQLRANELAKVMVIVHVPLIALMTWLLSRGPLRTDARRTWYADHIVGALHFMAFVMLYYSLYPYTVTPLLNGLNALAGGDLPVFRVSLILMLAYIPFMLRGAYRLSWWWLAPASALFMVGLYWIHGVYRFMQLVLTLYTMD